MKRGVAAAKMVTWVCAAIAALSSTLGIYWVAAEAVYRTKQFLAVACDPRNDLPVDIWERLYFFCHGVAGTRKFLGCFTTGLAAFIGREIEFESCELAPAILAQRVQGVCLYVLGKGMVLKDNDTLGISANERIRVRLQKRGKHILAKVISLAYEAGRATS